MKRIPENRSVCRVAGAVDPRSGLRDGAWVHRLSHPESIPRFVTLQRPISTSRGEHRPGVTSAVVNFLQGPLTLQAGLLEEVEIELTLGRGEDPTATFHDDLGGREKLMQLEAGGHPTVEHGRERRDVLRQEQAGLNRLKYMK